MATEDCAICGDSVPFATTTHVLVNPKHEEGVADHYVCRPCYDEHLEGLFAALSADENGDADLDVDVDGGADEPRTADDGASNGDGSPDEDGATDVDGATDDETAADGEGDAGSGRVPDSDGREDPAADDGGEDPTDEPLDASSD